MPHIAIKLAPGRSEEQKREQRISFAYGNTHIENSDITRQMVADADAKVLREESDESSRK